LISIGRFAGSFGTDACLPVMPAGTQDFLNILYWFEEERNTTDNEGLRN
jgi:hypothetical protein